MAVPITVPGSVILESVGTAVPEGGLPVAVETFARPKSRIFAKPSAVTITFSGLRSRCTTPAPCALARPSATCAAMRRSLFAGRGPPASSSRSVRPSISSMTMM